MSDCAPYLARRHTIPGWFHEIDVRLFQAVHALHERRGLGGDLLEIGVYHGQSAILLGYFRRPGERLEVCDIFDDEALNAANPPAHRRNAPPRRETFADTFGHFHPSAPPVIHACTSTALPDLGRRFRLVHVDGSHAYDVVRHDLALARRLLVDGGVVIVDDYRTAHTPGIARATWEAVAAGLRPIVASEAKLYASWSPYSADEVAVLRAAVAGVERMEPHVERVGEHDVLIAVRRGAPVVPIAGGRRGLARRLLAAVTGRRAR
jgi:hypothetical protein